jgi:hypothetical protein
LARRFASLRSSARWALGQSTAPIVVMPSSARSRSVSLRRHARLFETVLCAGDVHLMVIGYSWSDEHINAAIVRAVRDHRAKIYFWDIRDPRDMLGSVSGSDIILRDGFLGKASGTISAVMPAQPFNPITEEYKRIVAEFF